MKGPLLAACALCVALIRVSPAFAAADCYSKANDPAGIKDGVISLGRMAGSSPDDIWAVGSWSSKYDNRSNPLAEHFNGTSWTIVPVPSNKYLPSDFLSSVAVYSSTDAWAVGGRGTVENPASAPFVVHWDGTVWTEVPAPAIGYGGGAEFNSLEAVAVNPTNPIEVIAVGSAATPGIANTPEYGFAEQWNGSKFVPVVLPNPRSGPDAYSVSIAPTGQAWAVGDIQGNRGVIDYWNGSSWVQQSSNGAPPLRAVAANSATDVWAAGYGTSSGLFVHYDGTQWTRIPAPTLFSQAGIESMVAVSSNAVWAVGNAQPNFTQNADIPLVEYFDGTTWGVLPSLAPNSFSSYSGVYPNGSTAMLIGGSFGSTISCTGL